MFRHAIARRPGDNAGAGLTTAGLGEPDVARMHAQHDAYVRALESAGVVVTLLDADERFPDGCFVEDVAVVTPACAVVTRPGAPPRRGEEIGIEPLLAAHREVARIEAPGCVDGGDVVVAGERVLIGLSSRTNRDGAAQLTKILAARGFECRTVPVAGGLHLKSSVNHLGGQRLLASRDFAARDELAGFERLVVPHAEEYAANSLYLDDEHVLVPDGFPRTRELLERSGFGIIALDASEFRKMDGGLTCLSIRL